MLGSGLIYSSSAPGMSYGFNSFVEPFIEELSLKRIAIALAFGVSSILSAMVIPVAGVLIDKHGATRVTLVVAPTFVLTIFTLSYVETFPQLLACMVAARALGPECLVLTAQTTVQRWFVRRRGAAFAMLMLFRIVSTTLPANVALLMERTGGWRGAYRALAALVAMALTIGIALVRDSPEDLGMLPDGDLPDEPSAEARAPGDAKGQKGPPQPSAQPPTSTPPPRSPPAPFVPAPPPLAAATLREAMAHPIFWIVAILEAVWSMYWQGLNFHFVDLLSSFGDELAHLSATEAARALFVPMSVMEYMGNLTAGIILDYLTPRQRANALALIYSMIAAMFAASLHLRTTTHLALFAGTYGFLCGARGALAGVLSATLFGLPALARIQGATVAASVCAGGVGPLVFACSKSLTGSYIPAIFGCAIALLCTAIVTLAVVHRAALERSKEEDTRHAPPLAVSDELIRTIQQPPPPPALVADARRGATERDSLLAARAKCLRVDGPKTTVKVRSSSPAVQTAVGADSPSRSRSRGPRGAPLASLCVSLPSLYLSGLKARSLARRWWRAQLCTRVRVALMCST